MTFSYNPLSFLACTSAGVLAAAAFAVAEDINRDDPAAELASFKLAEGFEAQLFASEKDGVVKPVQIRWDSLGRLWVIGTQTYPQIKPGELPNDKVLILEDPNRTGHVQKVTEFASGLMIPTGLEVDGDARGCYVGEGTRIWHYRTNSQGRVERSVVLRGFGTGDNHQNINSFLWSPGGDLMFSQGLHGFARVETPWGISKLDHAGLWRLRPNELRLDSFFGGASEPQNPWGWVFNDWGQPFVVAGNNGGVYYPLPELIVGHDENRVGNIWVNARGRKSSGPDIVGTAHLPSEWQGVLLTGGYINNAVWALKVEADGAGFRISDLPPLITSSHGSFRPVDIKTGPDGAIYIADWYNPIIGHYQASFRHPDRDKVHGRIWRITYRGRPLVNQPGLAAASLGQLFEALRSPERWTRYQAKRVLSCRTGDVAGPLRAWCEKLDAKDPQTTHVLLDALGVFESRDEIEPDLLRKLLSSSDARGRAYATNVIAKWYDRLPGSFTAESVLAAMADDPDPQVRLAAVVSAGNIPHPESILVALRASQNQRDRFIDGALHEATLALKPQWLPLIRGALPNWKPQWVETLVRLDASPDTAGLIRRLLDDGNLSRETRLALATTYADTTGIHDLGWFLDPLHFVVGSSSDPLIQGSVLARLNAGNRWSETRVSSDEKKALEALESASSLDLRAQSLLLAAHLHLDECQTKLIQIARSATEPVKLRIIAVEAIGILGRSRDSDILNQIASDSTTLPQIRAAAVRAMAPYDLHNAAAVATGIIRNSRGVSETTEMLGILFDRKGGADELSRAIAEMPLPPDIAREALHVVRSHGWQSATLLKELQSESGQSSGGLRPTPDVIAELTKQIREKSDRKHGEEVFRRSDVGCTACHSVGGNGGVIGPPLDALGSGQPLDFIIGAVLDPQKEVKESYEAVEITTKDGKVLQGYRAREDEADLTLRDISQGLKEIRLRKGEIEKTREVGSLMPYGLTDRLSRQDLCDLFRYLSELGKQ